jgi:hypothetical protein
VGCQLRRSPHPEHLKIVKERQSKIQYRYIYCSKVVKLVALFERYSYLRSGSNAEVFQVAIVHSRPLRHFRTAPLSSPGNPDITAMEHLLDLYVKTISNKYF